MPAPTPSFIQLPVDTGNTGKKVRTQTRVVGPDTVHEHFFVQESPRELVGVYHAATVVQSVQAAAQNGTTTGFVWFFVTSPILKVALRRIEAHFGGAAATATVTVPRIAVQRMTYTGAPTGAQINPVVARSGDPGATSSLRIASIGATPVLGAFAYNFLPPNFLTAVGATDGPLREYEPLNEEGQLVFVNGEGFVVYQPDAGTASDPRRFVLNIAWEEFEL